MSFSGWSTSNYLHMGSVPISGRPVMMNAFVYVGDRPDPRTILGIVDNTSSFIPVREMSVDGSEFARVVERSPRIFLDTFTDDDGTLLASHISDTGQGWINSTNSDFILANRLRVLATNSTISRPYVSADIVGSEDNCRVACQITRPTANTFFIGFMFRHNGAPDGEWLTLQLELTPGPNHVRVKLRRHATGGGLGYAETYEISSAFPFAHGQTLEFSVIHRGPVLEAFYRSVGSNAWISIGSATFDVSYNDNLHRRVGFDIRNSGHAAFFDDLVVYPVDIVTSTPSLPILTWKCITGAFVDTSLRELWVDGGQKSISLASIPSFVPNELKIGVSGRHGISVFEPMTGGKIAEVSFWDADGLSVDDRDSLALLLSQGKCPQNLNTESPFINRLKAYWPLLNTSDLVDKSGNGNDLTMVGVLTDDAAHPNIERTPILASYSFRVNPVNLPYNKVQERPITYTLVTS